MSKEKLQTEEKFATHKRQKIKITSRDFLSPVETYRKWLRDTKNQQKNKRRMFTTTQQIKGERPQMYGNITFQKQSKN